MKNDRKTILNPNTNRFLELDIYLPKSKKAIAFNGDYWHSFDDRIKKDKLKNSICIDQNIKLLTIMESDWLKNIELMKETILKFII